MKGNIFLFQSAMTHKMVTNLSQCSHVRRVQNSKTHNLSSKQLIETPQPGWVESRGTLNQSPTHHICVHYCRMYMTSYQLHAAHTQHLAHTLTSCQLQYTHYLAHISQLYRTYNTHILISCKLQHTHKLIIFDIGTICGVYILYVLYIQH